MTSIQSFTLFTSLPTELRLKIWSLNLPGPRLVPLHYTSARSDTSNYATRKALRGCTSNAPIPANLLVNREARDAALKHYQLSLNLQHGAPKIWFDLQQDVLYFPAKEGEHESWRHFVTSISMVLAPQLAQVQRLAVHESLFTGFRDSHTSFTVSATCIKEFWEYISRKFTAVQEVIILLDGTTGHERSKDDEVRAWVEGMLGCVIGKGALQGMGERLLTRLERGLRFVCEEKQWEAPRWEVMEMPEDGMVFEEEFWPCKTLKELDLMDLEMGRSENESESEWEVMDGIVVPHQNNGSLGRRENHRKEDGLACANLVQYQIFDQSTFGHMLY